LESQTTASGDKKTEILYGAENAVGRGVLFMANVKNRMDLCIDYRAPSIVIEVLEYKNAYADIVNRGGKIRAVTEITLANMRYCKEMMKLVELRHLEGVKGGIAISESEYMATMCLRKANP
jgi:two-component system sensor histidine kinase VicK